MGGYRRVAESFGNALLLLVLVLSISATASFPSQAQVLPSTPPKLDALRQGGFIIFLRHATTDHMQNDQATVVHEDCTTQRNLSDHGRTQARQIGTAIRNNGIPIGEVFSSPFCRCTETADLAFGQGTVLPYLAFSIGQPEQERARAVTDLRSLLSKPVPPGTNRVIVSHTGNLQEATGIWPKPEGVAWVFSPNEEGFEVIGKILAEEWDALD